MTSTIFMQPFRRYSLPVVLTALFAAALFVAGQLGIGVPSAGAYVPNECRWDQVSSPNVNQYNELNAVAAISANNVWAVGSRGEGNVGQQTLIEHWDGSAWTVVSSPNPAPDINELLGMSALSASDIWAVGYYNDTDIGGTTQSLVLHWDGSGWTQVTSPNPGAILNDLYDVEAISANDVWAVGYAWTAGTRHRTMAIHWDGTQWSVVPTPNLSDQDNHLTSLDALSSSDIWAVGEYDSVGNPTQTIALHWDDMQWSVVASPSEPSLNTYLNGVSAASPGNVWAVGYSCPSNCFGANPSRRFAMHWDGSQWSIVTLPDINATYDTFNDVLALASNDVWVVGGYSTDNLGLTLIQHWDGSQWTLVPGPTPTNTTQELRAISAVSSTNIWSVGFFHFTGNPVFRTLTAHYTGSCVPPTPTPGSPTPTLQSSPTATVPTAGTSTTIPPTIAATSTPLQTGTATPISCTVSFTDVEPGNTFYPYVRCLACRDIISGYNDGTFKPDNWVTRGQLAKIVSNAANFTEPVSGQSFSDVPIGSTFYEYIERMAQRGIIGGYSDGTFRPGNNATRGQISKIVSNAKGYTDPAGVQIFEDVPSTNGFYEWIQRLAQHGAMGGYACGGAGEPCREGNRAYFRPQNNATRGQSSKIVSTTFFPQCNPMARP